MSSIENYDGLCGVLRYPLSSDYCAYEFGHSGKHSWQKQKRLFSIRGFIDSVLGEKWPKVKSTGSICKELGIEPCVACDAESYTECFVSFYASRINDLKDKLTIKEAILKTLNSSGAERMYCDAAIKKYYPEYKEWFEKIMVLK